MEVLVKRHYCLEDYTWINTRHDGGHPITQAYWIVQRLSMMFDGVKECDLGHLMHVDSITSYSGRVMEDAPFKAPLRRMFQEEGLAFE